MKKKFHGGILGKKCS